MKVAVLFGSYNPLTCAHVELLKTAVSSLGADLGLFVATNGKYLKRKTVKINDPFYLSEQERQVVIEKVCESEPNLKFWGFELGEINPNRYKTLLKIKSQYPTATIYEVVGADKLHTFTTPSYALDYVTNFNFAVFPRKEIDLEKLFAENKVLGANRSSFTILPTVLNVSDISSTEVRRRFCRFRGRLL